MTLLTQAKQTGMCLKFELEEEETINDAHNYEQQSNITICIHLMNSVLSIPCHCYHASNDRGPSVLFTHD